MKLDTLFNIGEMVYFVDNFDYNEEDEDKGRYEVKTCYISAINIYGDHIHYQLGYGNPTRIKGLAGGMTFASFDLDTMKNGIVMPNKKELRIFKTYQKYDANLLCEKLNKELEEEQ